MIVITIARKPIRGSTTTCVLENGCGAFNIAATRIGTTQRSYKGSGVSQQRYSDGRAGLTDGRGADIEFNVKGRWPANLILSHGCPVAALDSQSLDGGMHCAGKARTEISGSQNNYMGRGANSGVRYGDSGGASRFFKVFGDKK